MSDEPTATTVDFERERLDLPVDRAPLPGQISVVQAALAIGILLMGVQLWLLTTALELYLAGRTAEVWRLALVSGAIFLGGLLMLWLLRRRPRVRRLTTDETGRVERAE